MTFTEEHRRKISEACKGRVPWNKGRVSLCEKHNRPKVRVGKRGDLRCPACWTDYVRAWREIHPDRGTIATKAYNRRNPEKARASWRKEQLRRKFGITPAQYDAMFEAQGGRCKACGTHQDALARRLAVDHCHDTGAIRGLLCGKCNTALGLVDHNIDRLNSLAAYLSARTV